MESQNNINIEQNDCNLVFLDQNMKINIADNIATITVGYFIKNGGLQTVTNVFNAGTLEFSKDFIISNITTNNDLLTIIQTDGQIQYNGDLGTLIPDETVLVTIQFAVIGVGNKGDYLISNISEVVDGQGDNITYSENVLLNVVEITTRVLYQDGEFNFSMKNNSFKNIRTSFAANITIPTNIRVIFRSFDPLLAVYLNTNNVVPTNQVIEGLNVIKLLDKDILIKPFSTVVFAVKFDLYSSSELGVQLVEAQIQQIALPNDLVFIRVLPDKSDKAKAIVKLSIN